MRVTELLYVRYCEDIGKSVWMESQALARRPSPIKNQSKPPRERSPQFPAYQQCILYITAHTTISPSTFALNYILSPQPPCSRIEHSPRAVQRRATQSEERAPTRAYVKSKLKSATRNKALRAARCGTRTQKKRRPARTEESKTGKEKKNQQRERDVRNCILYTLHAGG